MDEIAAMVDDLIAAGASPAAAARVVAMAFAAGMQAAPSKVDQAAERRREKDRERKAAERAAKAAAEIGGNPQTSAESTDNVDTVSLSPVPLLSPIPPNNPLTPKPIHKTNNARGIRLPEDWKLSGPDLAYALSKGLSEQRTGEIFEKFCNWAWSASGSNAVKRDWHRAWQNWVLSEIEKPQARAGPTAKPLTPYRQKQAEMQDILHDLEDFSRRSGDGGEANPRLLPGNSGERPEELRGGPGADVIDLSAGGYRARN